MLSQRFKRLGLVISTIWLFGGGYLAYLDNSFADKWEYVEEMCLAHPGGWCHDLRSQAYENYSPDWVMILIYIIVGLLVIWGALLCLSWVLRGSSAN